MGFTTGLLGGFTLTTTILYLSLSLHTRNRLYQSALLNQQSILLTNIVEPLPATPTPVSREVRAGVLETAKDRWNAELERNVRQAQNLDWSGVREGLERRVGDAWGAVFAKGREVVPDPSKS